MSSHEDGREERFTQHAEYEMAKKKAARRR